MDDELTTELLIRAYAAGAFPMSDPLGRIVWYSPDPRAIIELSDFYVPRTLRQTLRRGRFQICVSRDFEGVVHGCAAREEGTWISDELIRAYLDLHRHGFAHSVECYERETLVGGLYGVCLGGAFFGESMFSLERDASKVALVNLVERMRSRDFKLLDIQFLTPHLKRFGAREIPRNEYLVRLRAALKTPCSLLDDPLSPGPVS